MMNDDALTLLSQLITHYKAITLQFVMHVLLYDPIRINMMESYLSSIMVKVYHPTHLTPIIIAKSTQLIDQLNNKNGNGIKI